MKPCFVETGRKCRTEHFSQSGVNLIHSRLALAGTQSTHGSRDQAGVARNRWASRLGGPVQAGFANLAALNVTERFQDKSNWMAWTVWKEKRKKDCNHVNFGNHTHKRSYSQRMTPSFRPCWKPSPMHIPVVSSIQKRSSSSLCRSYFWAIWNTGADKFIAQSRHDVRRKNLWRRTRINGSLRHTRGRLQLTCCLKKKKSPTCCLATDKLQSTGGPAGWGGLKGGRPSWEDKCFNVGMRCEAALSVGIYLSDGGWNHSRERIQMLLEAFISASWKNIAPFVVKKSRFTVETSGAKTRKSSDAPQITSRRVFPHTSHSISDTWHA